MGKGPGRTRVKGATNKKQKRWKKGQSCVTNPVVKKHRQEAARSRMFPTTHVTKSSLTTDALAKHNEDIADVDDNVSVGGDHTRPS
ncbi:putative RRP12-like protein isoform X2 [Apostichopus japonicus]|uniref:Putative RRP12-like protein isoform X2 n=1 Tax=Stichopus japonicus TaxID=307972 RepID=A0A2G8JWC5_STIJA|nr:putative RRP12-like protein isoform X2 [Apostichopus japonicus]